MSQFRYRIYPLQSLVDPAEQYHSNLRQEKVLAPLQIQSALKALLPPLDVWEDSDAFYVTLETPGVKRENMTLSLQENILNIKGHKAPSQLRDGQTSRRRERGFGDFSRDILLPRDVQNDAVKAHLENGVLMVTLPKTESSKPRRIPIGNVKNVDAE
ncbi:MAG: Hsp20/alpha crystallin family protein [Abditibacteriaceae bacterium]